MRSPAKPAARTRRLDRIDRGIAEGHAQELRRVGVEGGADRASENAGERIVIDRVPVAEDIASAGLQHPARFAISLLLVGEEHHAELADHRVERPVGEGKRGRVGRLERDGLAGPEFAGGSSRASPG